MLLKLFRSLVLLLLMAAFLILSPSVLADGLLADGLKAEGNDPGVRVFELYCAGCHVNGGNIVRRGKNLKLKTLQRYGLDSIASITELVKNGKNNMSAYGDRLSEAEIQAVATYVLARANQDWR